MLYGHRLEHRCRILKKHLGGNATEFENTYTKWLEQGRFFLLPNEIFTLGLSAGEIAVYAYLIFCEDRETHVCYPSFRKIGEHTGMSPNTVRKYITQLEDKQLIETLPTTVWTLDGTARNGTLLYTILPIYEAVNYHLERQFAGLPQKKRTRKRR